MSSLIRGILVYSASYNKVPQTRWVINNRNVFIMFLEARKSTIRVLVNSVSSEELSPGSVVF